jgi:hypothetical protein
MGTRDQEHHDMRQNGQRGLVHPSATPSNMAKEATPGADSHHPKLWNSPGFSDLSIKFSGREIKAHRLILCQASAYFDKALRPG